MRRLFFSVNSGIRARCPFEVLVSIFLLGTIILSIASTGVPIARADFPFAEHLIKKTAVKPRIAVNPVNPNNVVAAYFDLMAFPCYNYSLDGGDTWFGGGLLPEPGPQPYLWGWGDQLEIAFDNEGYLYCLIQIQPWPGFPVSPSNCIFVASPDSQGNIGSQAFSEPQWIDSDFWLGSNLALAVDRTSGSGEGNVYVIYDYFEFDSEGWLESYGVYCRKCRRGSGTDSMKPLTTTRVSADWGSGWSQFSFAGGVKPSAAIGPNGEVYVAYREYYPFTANSLCFSRSLNGGLSFSVCGKYVTHITPPGEIHPVSGDFEEGFSYDNGNPALGVSQTTGCIFMVWADRRNGDSDIFLSRSTDRGDSWSDPSRVNQDLDSHGDQWMPQLTFNSDGSLYVAYYDRRDDPANEYTAVYISVSGNSGNTFSDIYVGGMTSPYWYLNEFGARSDGFGCINIASTGFTPIVIWEDGRFLEEGYWSSLYVKQVFSIVITPMPAVILVQGSGYTCHPPDYPAPRDFQIPLKVLPVDGFQEPVSLTAEGIPPGVPYYFENSSAVPPFDAALHIIVNSTNMPEGTYGINVTAHWSDEQYSHPIQFESTSEAFVLPEGAFADPGEDVPIYGEGFTPPFGPEISPFEVLFDGTWIAAGFVDSNGFISSLIQVPANASDGPHTVLVRDMWGVEASTTLNTPFPWVHVPRYAHDVEAKLLVPSKTVVGKGYDLDIQMCALNTGSLTETFEVKVYANDTCIQTGTLNLSGMAGFAYIFSLNTENLTYGDYTLWAYADPVPGETHTADNMLFGNHIFVTLPGDVDGNRYVNIFDIVRMAVAYGAIKPDLRYDSNCDIEGDGDIDIFDLVAAAMNYGKNW